ncbi:hypothetical protein [Streptomyces sp. NBC_01304]|uniref:hypothetical protein n=1 Tax=Streptomyces sp. NBC_01304 TaxID=2903818 RepID=UPI002E11CA98|nr:hypothetical protein OG430_08035 [Streptomyces sp. NBC_01304]
MPDAGESTTDRRQKLAGLHEAIFDAGDKNTLIGYIDDCLKISPPVGSPSTLESLAEGYQKQLQSVRDVTERIEKIGGSTLPDVWVGSTGAKAAEVIMAAGRSSEQMEVAFKGAAKALFDLADVLTQAQGIDRGGREQMREARSMLGGEDGWFDDMVEKDAEEEERLRARSIAYAGASRMHTAAEKADDAARAAARDLNKLASEARAGKMKTDNISAADRLVLADIAGPEGRPR